MATLDELRTRYSLDDLRDMHEALDQREEYEQRWRAYYKAHPET